MPSISCCEMLFYVIFYWLTDWCLQTHITWQWLRLWASVRCLFSPRSTFSHTTVHTIHSSWLLCVLFIFAHHEKCRFCGRHMMAFICTGNSLPLYCISIIIIIMVFPKSFKNKYAKKLGILTRVGTIVDRKKVLKQAGVVHDIKSQ